MNRREIAISIITTMVVITIFASTATAAVVTVDGDGSEWAALPAAGLDTAVDADGIMELPSGPCAYYTLNWSSGYDMADFAMYYDAPNDTLYFKWNVSGVPGDTDGDYDPSGCTYCTFTGPNGNCTDPWATWPRASADNDGVMVGAYKARLDVDGDGNEDYRVLYYQNRVWVKDPTEGIDHSDNFTRAGSIGDLGGSWSAANMSNVVEASLSPARNLSGFGLCGDFIVKEVSCGTGNDYLPEDPIYQFTANLAPVSVPVVTDVCYCTYTSFSSSGSYDPDGYIVKYEWDFGDGNNSTDENPTHHYGAAGTYTVNLTVTDDYGFECLNTTTAHVYGNPTADFDASYVYWCEDTTFNDTSYGGTPPYTYAWDLGDGNTSTEQNVSHHYAVADEYTVCLNITDANDCTDEICKNVTVNRRPPVPNATFRGVGCLDVELNASGSYDPQGTITKYEWDLDNNGVYEVDALGNPLYTWYDISPCGYHTIGLRVTNDGGINNSTTAQIYVDCPPTAVCAANRTSVNDTTGGWVLFDGSGSTDPEGYSLNYTWVIHGATFYTPTVTYYVINETTAYLTVRDEYGCEDTCNVTVIASPGKGEPHADANGPYKTCVGYSIIFDASGSSCSGCNIDWYEWDYYNNGTYIKTSKPIHEYTYPGEYRGIVRLRVTVDACNNTDTDTAFVIVEPCDPAAVPIMTPLGVLALISMLCIAGVGRVMKRSRRS